MAPRIGDFARGKEAVVCKAMRTLVLVLAASAQWLEGNRAWETHAVPAMGEIF
jgi:hypothetical protein